MKKYLLGLTFVALTVFGLSSRSEAAGAARSPKEMATVGYVTGISSVTQITVALSTAGMVMPGAIYQMTLSTGALQDFLILLDTNTAAGYGSVGSLTTGAAALQAHQIGPRFVFSSTTSATTYTFDPPITFFNGLFVMLSSAFDSVGITYETGRGLSGE